MIYIYVMKSLHDFPFQDLLDDFTEPAFIVRSNSPSFSLLASNYARADDKASLKKERSDQNDVFSILGAAQSGFSVLEAGLNECLTTGHIIWLSGFQFLELQTTDNVESAFWQLELRPISTQPGNIEYLLITSHRIDEVPASETKLTLNDIAREKARASELREFNIEKALTVQTELNQSLKREIELLRQLMNTLPETGAIDALLRKKRGDNESIEKLNIGFLVEENQGLKDFFMQAPLSFAVLGNHDLIIELINERFALFLPQRPLLGKPLLEAMPELTGEPVLAILKNVYLTGETYKVKDFLISRIENNQAVDHYANMIFKARRNMQGKVDGVFVFGIDVTDSVKVKLKLESSENKYASILNAIPHIAWTNSTDVVINFVNQHWFDYSGLKVEETVYWGWEDAVYEKDYAVAKAKLRSIVESGSQGEFELRYRRADGEYRWHLCRVQPVYNDKGNIDFYIGTATDIEVLKRLQQQKDDFVNIVSHELKTPLTSLKLSIQLVSERAENFTPQMISGLMQRASKSLDKIEGLVDDLLNAGKLTQGQFYLNKSVFSPVSIIEEYCRELQVTDQFRVEFTGDTRLCVYADAKRIEQVMVNFLNNAIKYAPDSRLIQIDVKRIGNNIRVAVSDNGPGIKPELVPNLFDRYYSVKNRSYQDSGLGLGLFICAEIINKHGGEINVETELNKGSTFWFTLPASV